ncbi:MAG: hypothetical protein Q9201_003785 [Fulgogasparrea decipioides]
MAPSKKKQKARTTPSSRTSSHKISQSPKPPARGRPRRSAESPQKTSATQKMKTPKRVAKPTSASEPQRFKPPGYHPVEQREGSNQSSSSGLATAETSIVDELVGMREYLLHSEDRFTNPDLFSARYENAKTFVADLAGAPEVAGLRQYEEVKALLRYHAERMGKEEKERESAVMRNNSASTESSGRAARVFSPDLAGQDGEGESPPTTVSSHHFDRTKRMMGLVERSHLYDDDDGDVLVFVPPRASGLEASETVETTARHGKRSLEQDIDSDIANKRKKTRRAKTVAKGITEAGKKRHNPRAKRKIDRSYKPKPGESGDEEDEVRFQARGNRTAHLAKPGSGSLIPPEIVNFDTADEQEPMDFTDDGEEHNLNPDEQFWPGDPVFMFGETKYLEALKSRQIDLDLAADDKKAQEAVQARPLEAMHARFRLPNVDKELVEEKKKKGLLNLRQCA